MTTEPNPNIINVDAFRGPITLHWGSSSNYGRFCDDGSYFVRESAPEERHYVVAVEYKPDELYRQVDGMAGRCWMVVIRGAQRRDDITGTYYIRNWIDIVKCFETLGYKFVQQVSSVM